MLSLRQRSFVLAARCLGVPEHVILLRHVLRNALPVAIVTGALHFGSAVLRRKAQMIFQDPFETLNPRMSVGAAIAEPIRLNQPDLHRRDVREAVADLLRTVGLEPQLAGRYPHECSGGQLQRAGISRALAVSPAFLVADEPTSALDVGSIPDAAWRWQLSHRASGMDGTGQGAWRGLPPVRLAGRQAPPRPDAGQAMLLHMIRLAWLHGWRVTSVSRRRAWARWKRM